MDPVSAALTCRAFPSREARKIQQISQPNSRCVMPGNAGELSFRWNGIGVKFLGGGIEKSDGKIAKQRVDTETTFAGLFLREYSLSG